MRIIVPGIVLLLATSGFVSSESLPQLVTPAELAAHMETQSVQLIDARDNARRFRRGHIPGAVLIPIEGVFDTIDGVRGRLPTVGDVIEAFESAGIGSDLPIVIYDESDNLWASRFFWALEYLGHQSVHLLDGGFDAWKRGGFEINKETSPRPRANFEPRVREKLLVTSESMLEIFDSSEITVVDARSNAEFIGRRSFSRRRGHIPGPVNVDWRDHLDDGGSFATLAELASLYSEQGVEPDADIITYCQAGVRATHAYFSLRLMGYESVVLYDDSWEYSGNQRHTPIAR